MPLKSWLKYIGLIILILSVKPSSAFLQIKYIGIEHGLSNNSVNCIFKDNYGFMWIGTNSGLNRYDGNKFKIFKNIWDNPASLSCNYISSLTGLGNHILVGTQKYLVYYDYTDSKFYPVYYQPSSGGSPKKVRSAVYSLLAGKSGKAYAATEGIGLLVFDKNSTQCKQIPFGRPGKPYTVTALNIDDAGRLWLFIKDTGLCLYDFDKKNIRVVNHDIKLASCLLKDKENHIWIGAENGLYLYDIPTGKLNRFAVAGENLTSENIVDLKLDADRKLWIATNGGGVNIFDIDSQKLSYIVPGEEKGSLRSGAVSVIYEDNEQRKWIGTLRGGINVIEAKNKPFSLFTHDPFNKNSVINNFILSFCQDEANNIWIGTDGGGLSYWDVKSNTYTSYAHSRSPGSLISNFVVSIVKDYTNRIWVATFSGGIDAFDKTTKTFKHYACYNTVDKKEDKNLWKLFEDSKHNLWAGATRGGALYLFDRKNDKFELFDANLVNIHTLYEDHGGTLWGGDYTRLIKIDRVNKRHRFYNIDNAIRAITQGADNNLWIGTDDAGLLSFNPLLGTYSRYMQANGLCDNSVLNILVDNRGNLWCSTYNGLSCFNPNTRVFKNYDVSDGLQSNQFNYNAALKLKSGEMLFGGISGFNLFDPDRIGADIRRPQIRLTGLHINNAVFDQSSDYTGNQPLVSLKSITVPYNQATIAVDYTALEYSYPDKINYAYYLEGWDHGWNYVGQLKSAYYTRLNEGVYTLHIKATDTGGAWLPNQQLVIMLTVLPPWYRTWWAYLLYTSITAAVIYWFWLYRSRQTKLKYEVEIANLKVEREKELNEKKLSFFTNISHEFRTPLTLIINPIKDLLNKGDSNKEELSLIYRNARRLLGLVDHLLLFRKAESENNQMKVSKLNFIGLCNEVFMCFTQQVKVKHLEYQLRTTHDEIEIYVDREKIEIVLFNLISNAIKFTPDGGSIFLNVFEDEGHVWVEIADNGIGINTDVGDKLFSKFYQVKDKNYFKTGFGIGLYLVKVFIENHNGSISYHNTKGGGTTFRMSLPKGKSHFNSEQLFEPEDQVVYINDLIDHDDKAIVLQEEDTNNLELLISGKPTIMVIDDNDQIRAYIKKIFISDYLILEAADGRLGLELIKRHLPDIIVSDIVMNDLDGLELCKIVKQDSAISHIPIILLTGDSTPDMMLKSIEGGAVDFLSKPFEKEILLAKVKSVLRNKTELQNYFYNEVTLKNSSRHVSEEHKAFLYNCIALIEHDMMEPDFGVQKIAREMAISYPTLYKKIKAITGQSVNNFIRFVRLRKAAELLIHTNCNVNEAALQVGFNDIKYFREHFNKQFGINPSEFIKKHRTAFQISYRIKSKGNSN